MKKIKSPIAGKKPDVTTLQDCKNLQATLEANPVVKDAPKEFTDFGAAITTAEEKVTAFNVSNAATKDALVEKDAAIDALRVTGNQLINYLQYTSNGDEQVILGYGLDVRKGRTPSAVPGTVMGVIAVAGDYAGRLDLQWNRLGGAKHYEVEYCMEPMTEAGWKSCPSVTKSRAVLEDLASGVRAWIRVRGSNAKGQGAWSNPVSRIVP